MDARRLGLSLSCVLGVPAGLGVFTFVYARGFSYLSTDPGEKLDKEPWLRRIFAGIAFALDYRDRRGHFYSLLDQTRRVTERPQPGACLQ